MKKKLILFCSVLLAVVTGCQKDPFEGREATLSSFSFKAADNAALEADFSATISGTAVEIGVPFMTDLSALVATFETTDKEAKVFVADKEQVSGSTANDFSSPVKYIVKLGDSKSMEYTVTVTPAADPYEGNEPDITSFSFKAEDNPEYLLVDVEATISGDEIDVLLPYGTELGSLVATFTTAHPDAVVKVNGTAQVSGETANDFSIPVDYIVTLGLKKNKMYTVTASYLPEAQWSAAGSIDVKAACMRMVMLAGAEGRPASPLFVMLENVASSRGPVKVCNGVSGSIVQVTPEGFTAQYLGAGVSPQGKLYIYTNDYAATSADRCGAIFSSSDYNTFSKEDVRIDYSNGMYGTNVGFSGNDVFVMSSNNAAAGTLGKRNINVTKFDGSAWSTGNALADRGTTLNSYFPYMFNGTDGNLYTFVTNMTAPTGFSVYKYESNTWKETFTVDDSGDEFKAYIYGSSTTPQMLMDANGKFILASGSKSGTLVRVLMIDPNAAEGQKVVKIGNEIDVLENVSARYVRLAITPLGDMYLAYRKGKDPYTLCVSKYDVDKADWGTPSELSTGAIDEINIAFNEIGVGFVSCAADEKVELFTLE